MKTIYLTKHMGGEKISKIGEASTREDVFKVVSKFTTEMKDTNQYRITPYFRYIFAENGDTYVDFGDYTYFLMISPGITIDK